ncbi:DNA repair protein [Vibrio sp. CAU 1672]|uniref:DNA repair protein n=1 Tax=Vibrio sp. CAU 1672 TaxID=3032594 RepID=UPI0023DCA632|nr:DNA repair protein [Vibrio sp. CAU 1672]MDF2154666.1 DNA repair protein [Vibrio sp. CAU 1672]
MFGVSKQAVVSGLHQASELKAKLFSLELEVLQLKAESEYMRVQDELIKIKETGLKLIERGALQQLEREKYDWNSSCVPQLEQRIHRVEELINDCHLYVENVKNKFTFRSAYSYDQLRNSELEEQLETLCFSQVPSNYMQEYFYNSKQYEDYQQNMLDVEYLCALKDEITSLYNKAA